MDPLLLGLIAAFVVLYGLVSARLERASLSGPMVFVAERTMTPELLLAPVAFTVLASVFLHGVSAAPASRAYGRSLAKTAAAMSAKTMPEMQAASPLPARKAS